MTPLALVAAEPVRWRKAIGSAASRVTPQVVAVTFAIAAALQAWSLYDASFASADPFAAGGLVSSMIVNVLVAFCIMFTTFVADEVVAIGAPPLPVYAFGVLAGSASATLAQWLVHKALGRTAGIPGWHANDSVYAVFVFFEYLIWGTIAVWIYVNRRGEMRAKARMEASRLQRAETQRRSLEAQLTALQAQVEPRFLLDMLACARDRYDLEPASGSTMLGALIAYLRTALPRWRETASDLGREIELARKYVDVMREHQGGGLAFESEVPDPLGTARMPAMLMLPLIHGIVTRRPAGARPPALIGISARVADDRLRVRIVHDAPAFASDDTEVAGVRQRLRALYGAEASFTIDHEPSAILEIPFEPADGDHR